MTALRLNHNIPNSSFLDSEQVTVDSNEDFGQRFRQQILFVGGPNFIIYTWDDTACLEQHYQTQPQNNLCVFGCLVAGGGGGCDGVVMMSVWLLRIIILLVKRYCNRIESINFTYTNIVCVSGSVWAKKKKPEYWYRIKWKPWWLFDSFTSDLGLLWLIKIKNSINFSSFLLLRKSSLYYWTMSRCCYLTHGPDARVFTRNKVGLRINELWYKVFFFSTRWTGWIAPHAILVTVHG